MLSRVIIPLVFSAGLALCLGDVSAQRSDLDAARHALGIERLTDLRIEFDYTGGIGPRGGGGDTANGTGRVLFRQPASYRVEFYRKGSRGTSHQVSQEHQGVFNRWWTRGGRTQHVEFDAAGLASARKRLQREMMVYLSALVLADVPFLTYEARDPRVPRNQRVGEFRTIHTAEPRGIAVPVRAGPACSHSAFPWGEDPHRGRAHAARSGARRRLPSCR
jgi:hypothetical protein